MDNQLYDKIKSDHQLLRKSVSDFLTNQLKSISTSTNLKKCIKELMNLHEKKKLSKEIQQTILYYSLQRNYDLKEMITAVVSNRGNIILPECYLCLKLPSIF
jgi:hypothetical protein